MVNPPSPAMSGLSLSVTAGHGTRFPTPPFNAVVCPANQPSVPENAEIVRVNSVAADVFTILRAQEGTEAKAINAGDQIYAGVTKKTLDDIHVQIETHVHVQGAPSDTWVVVHNMNDYPSVTVVDTGESVIIPNVHYDSPNQITLGFASPTSGKVYVN